MTPEQIVAFVAALAMAEPDPAAFATIRQGGADARYPVKVAACPRPVAPFEIEGKTLICGTVNVPENHAKPAGRRIDLSFVVYKSRSQAPAKDAVVHLHGGPGGGIVQAVSLTSVFFDKLRQRRDIVAFDQRGVDTSGGNTRCYSTVAQNAAALAGSLAGKKLSEEADMRLVGECVAELKERGTDITMINTAENARDVGAVMRALGYPDYNVYGISYGTKLGLEVMRTAPEGVRAVVLDLVAPPHVPTYDTLAVPHAEAIQSTFDQCAANAECAAAYPDLKNRYWALLTRLESTPIASKNGPIKAVTLFTMLNERNNWNGPLRGLTALVPRMIAELERGDTTTYDAVRDGKLPEKLTADSASKSLAGISPDEQAYARIALLLAKQEEATQAAAAQALRQLETDRATGRAGTAVAALFDARLARAAKALPDANARAAFARDYMRLRAQTPAAAPLNALIAAHFQGRPREELSALVVAMGPADLRETFGRVSRDNIKLENVLTDNFESEIFLCQEDMDINSLEGARRVHATLPFPKSVLDEFEGTLKTLYQTCRIFGMHPRPGFHDPVRSPIPALVFSGTLDTQTATSWGPETARYLPNGRSVVFPETGHGALAFSDCALDLGVAFIENPAAKLDTSCVATLAPRFVLPDGKLTRR